MGLFGRKKTYGELALEEARRLDRLEAKVGASTEPASVEVPRAAKPNLDDRMIALVVRVLAKQFGVKGASLADEFEEIRRKYAGRPKDDAKPALRDMLARIGQEVPEPFLDTMAEAVTGDHG